MAVDVCWHADLLVLFALAVVCVLSCNAPHDRCNHVHALCIISTQLSSNN